jgi:transposase
MRASYDSLCLKVKSLLEQDPFSGHVFVFINRRRTSVKCLCYDGTGLVWFAREWSKVHSAESTHSTNERLS